MRWLSQINWVAVVAAGLFVAAVVVAALSSSLVALAVVLGLGAVAAALLA